MKSARIGLIGLGLLVAVLPATVGAKENEKENEAIPSFIGKKNKQLSISCNTNNGQVDWSFQVKNRGDQPGVFNTRLRIDTGNKGKAVVERLELDLGSETYAPGDVKTFHAVTTVGTPGPTFAELKAETERADSPNNIDASTKRKVRCR